MKPSILRSKSLLKMIFTFFVFFSIVAMANAGCEEGVKYKRCKRTCHAVVTYTDSKANEKCSGMCKQMFGISHDSDCLIWDFECCCGPKASDRVRYPNKYESNVDDDAQNNAYDPQTATGNAGEPLPRDDDDKSENDTDSGYSSTPSDTTEYHSTISDVYSNNQGFIFPNPNTVYRESESETESESNTDSDNSETDSFQSVTIGFIDSSDYYQSSDDDQSNSPP